MLDLQLVKAEIGRRLVLPALTDIMATLPTVDLTTEAPASNLGVLC